jgi:hypothetical protein
VAGRAHSMACRLLAEHRATVATKMKSGLKMTAATLSSTLKCRVLRGIGSLVLVLGFLAVSPNFNACSFFALTPLKPEHKGKCKLCR